MKKTVVNVCLFILLGFPFLLWALPVDFFDESRTLICPSKLFFGTECWACDIYSAIIRFHHFELEEAAYYNPLVFLVYPLLFGFWAKWVYDAAKFLGIIVKGTKTPNIGTL